MKKIIAIVLALLMVFALAACGSDDNNTGKPADNENNANQQAGADNGKTDPAGNEAAESAEHPALKLCGLTVADIEAGVTTLNDGAMETESAFVGSMTSAEFTFESFEKWVNALAENCRKVSKDGKLYESEMSTDEVTSFSLDANVLMNVVQFIYRTSNKVIYVTVSYAKTGSAFSCKLEAY